MLDAFHKSAYYLVDRNIKDEWPSILTEHLCYKLKQEFKNISMFLLYDNMEEKYSRGLLRTAEKKITRFTAQKLKLGTTLTRKPSRIFGLETNQVNKLCAWTFIDFFSSFGVGERFSPWCFVPPACCQGRCMASALQVIRFPGPLIVKFLEISKWRSILR